MNGTHCMCGTVCKNCMRSIHSMTGMRDMRNTFGPDLAVISYHFGYACAPGTHGTRGIRRYAKYAWYQRYAKYT